MAESPASIAASAKAGEGRKRGDTGGSRGANGGAAPRAVVMIVNVVVAAAPPGVTVVELNVAVECAGKPATVKETALVNPSARDVGVTVITIIACCPALTGVLAGPLTVKPSTVKTNGPLAPPPGAGFVTVTFTMPEVATSLAGTVAVTCVVLTRVVVSALLLKLITDVETKFVPVTISINGAPPETCVLPAAVAFVTVGDGLLTVKVNGPDGPTVGAGLLTITCGEPPVATSAAGIVTVICVAVMAEGVRPLSTPKSTFAPATKLLPVMVSVHAATPAFTLVGESVVTTGLGLLIVKVWPVEDPPAGGGLHPVTVAVPPVMMSVAGIAAVSCVLLTNVVGRLAPFQFTVGFVK